MLIDCFSPTYLDFNPFPGQLVVQVRVRDVEWETLSLFEPEGTTSGVWAVNHRNLHEEGDLLPLPLFAEVLKPVPFRQYLLQPVPEAKRSCVTTHTYMLRHWERSSFRAPRHETFTLELREHRPEDRVVWELRWQGITLYDLPIVTSEG